LTLTLTFKVKSPISTQNGKKHFTCDLPRSLLSPASCSDVNLAGPMTDDTTAVLQVVPVRVFGNDGRHQDTYALLDSGAQTSLCCRDLVDRLCIDGEYQALKIGNVEGTGERKQSMKFTMKVQPTSPSAINKMIDVNEVWSVPKLNIAMPRINKQRVKSMAHLNGLAIPYPSTANVEVLLGANVAEAIIQHEVKTGRPGQPIAVRTDFGWVITGTMTHKASQYLSREVMSTRKSGEDLQSTIQAWWSTEAFGTKYDKPVAMSREDQRAEKLLQQNTRYLGDRYEASLLWKADDVKMPNNYVMALKRLQSTENKLHKDQAMAEAYSQIFADYVSQGHARKLSKPEAETPNAKRWFLPHHAVVNPNKVKIRVVFDAAAMCHGVSLNNQLLTGPDLLQSLPGVLIRFREEPIAITADIEKMYHQVKIKAEDQPALSFLWRNLDKSKPPDVCQMEVAVFGARCSPAIANYVLQKTAEDHATAAEDSKAIKESFYMDDFLKSEKTVEAAIDRAKSVTALLKKGGFHLTKWASNNREVLQALPASEVSNSTIDLNCDNLPSERVLGVIWNPDTDTIGFKVRESNSNNATKRSVLSQLSSVFDPFGIASPYTLQAKMLMQQLWNKKLDWNEELTGDDLDFWQKWHEELTELAAVTISRCFLGPDDEAVKRELHLFCDASDSGFGAVAYFR